MPARRGVGNKEERTGEMRGAGWKTGRRHMGPRKRGGRDETEQLLKKYQQTRFSKAAWTSNHRFKNFNKHYSQYFNHMILKLLSTKDQETFLTGGITNTYIAFKRAVIIMGNMSEKQ